MMLYNCLCAGINWCIEGVVRTDLTRAHKK